MITETGQVKIRVLDPIADAPRVSVGMAPRPETPRGKVVGLLDNGKINADKLLDRMADLLKSETEIADVFKLSNPEAPRPAPGEIVDSLAGRCDAAVVAVGD